MPSSWSPSLRFELQFTGENINLWGEKLNSALRRVDSAIAGWTTIPLTGDRALTAVNDGADEARSAMLKFTGGLSANATITLPAVSKAYFVFNATEKALTFTTGGAATVIVDPGDRSLIECDGTNVHDALFFGGLGLKAYIAAAALGATGQLPAQPGNTGKFVKTDGANASWQQIQSSDIGDFDAEIRRRVLVYTLIFGG
jgi:hypothetical protein